MRGLRSVDLWERFWVRGIFILMLAVEVGGIGIMRMKSFLWLLFGKKMGLKERQLIERDENELNL